MPATPSSCGGLLERGADVNKLNERGQSIVAGAVFQGDEAIVRMLIDANADPDAGHPTARETATMFGRASLIELLPPRREA